MFEVCFWSCFNNTILGQSCHCLFRKNMKLRHSLGRPSRSDFVQFEFVGEIMEEKITLCGDNCIECPRYNAHTEEELKAVAELWYKVGWRACVVSNEEISCSGCSSHKQCTYKLVECIKEHRVDKCNKCKEFPCIKIKDMLEHSAEYKRKCKEVCSEQEYTILEKAFFNKENNLKKQ